MEMLKYLGFSSLKFFKRDNFVDVWNLPKKKQQRFLFFRLSNEKFVYCFFSPFFSKKKKTEMWNDQTTKKHPLLEENQFEGY